MLLKKYYMVLEIYWKYYKLKYNFYWIIYFKIKC